MQEKNDNSLFLSLTSHVNFLGVNISRQIRGRHAHNPIAARTRVIKIYRTRRAADELGVRVNTIWRGRYTFQSCKKI